MAHSEHSNGVLSFPEVSIATGPISYSHLLSQLVDQHPQVFIEHPLEEYVRLLDAMPVHAEYHFITDAVLAVWRDIQAREGAATLELYNRATMLKLICDFEERAADRYYTSAVVGQFQQNFGRIVQNIAEAPIGAYLHTSDNFLKDMALCRQIVFPLRGAQVVMPNTALQRSVLLSGGIAQFLRFLFMLVFVTKGRRPIYRTHTHLSRVNDFTAEGRDLCFIQIAEMLERHPEVKGWCGCSWLYDPALGNISPRLADLCHRAADNGGWVFFVANDESGGAIAKSPTRKKLFEEGKYTPKSYMVVWPREELISWAKLRRSKLAD